MVSLSSSEAAVWHTPPHCDPESRSGLAGHQPLPFTQTLQLPTNLRATKNKTGPGAEPASWNIIPQEPFFKRAIFLFTRITCSEENCPSSHLSCGREVLRRKFYIRVQPKTCLAYPAQCLSAVFPSCPGPTHSPWCLPCDHRGLGASLISGFRCKQIHTNVELQEG